MLINHFVTLNSQISAGLLGAQFLESEKMKNSTVTLQNKIRMCDICH